MQIRISGKLFLDFLQCKQKAFLKLTGKNGVKTDFDKYQDENIVEYFKLARDRIITGDNAAISTANRSFKEIREHHISAAFGISILNDKHSIMLDAAELALQSTRLKPVYSPIIFLPHQKINKEHKLLLAFYGLALGNEQKKIPLSGRIIFGKDLFSTKVQLASLINTAGKVEKEITDMIDKQTAPPLRLNNHCKICEFQEICSATARAKDDLSLLKGLSGKEIDMLNKRGIFTVTQYSYTFRPRRPHKIAYKQINKHHHSLNALAIRTQTIYIARKPELPDAPKRVYLDVEGIPDENLYYCIGLVIDDGANITTHSFWASDKTEEKEIWSVFLEKMADLEDFVLFHYGSYETKFLKRMGVQYGGNSELLAKIESGAFNVLSAIYGHIYFPTYSNDLKSVASFLGFKWSEPNASGLTSVLCRKQWDKSHDESWKQKVIEYNNDDCLAVRAVDACLRSISTNDNAAHKNYPAKHTDELKAQKPLWIFKRNQFYYPELEQINKRAYFDYQRSKVFLRTSLEVKKSITRKIKLIKQVGYKINNEISFDVPKRCPLCKTGTPIKHLKASRIVVRPKNVQLWN